MKICRRCGEEKALEGYYKHSQMLDGHLNICKECVKKQRAEHRLENIDKIRAYDRERASQPQRKEKRKKITAKRRNEVEGYQSCHNAVMRAIKKGTLQRANTCQICAKQGKTEAHHHDYTRTLKVVWLCPACHRAYHMGKTEKAEKIRIVVDIMLDVGGQRG